MFSTWKGDCASNQCPWWSGIYDTCLDSKRLGFDPQLRQRIFSDPTKYIYQYVYAVSLQYEFYTKKEDNKI